MPKVRRMTNDDRSHLLALTAAAAVLSLSAGGADARARHVAHHAPADPVVVELYTAQGCSTCPKANGVVADLAAQKAVLPLTFSVDYWDYLGWEDTLAKPEFAERQRAYVQRLKVREIYTPEMVVNGDTEGPALEGKTIASLISDAEENRYRGPRIRFFRHGARVKVGGEAKSGHGDVWLIRYDPEPESVKIKSGENKGQTVTVRNAVHELTRLGAWRGTPKTYVIPPAGDAGLKAVVLVQGPKGGRIFAAARG
jgi:hypothetical protein